MVYGVTMFANYAVDLKNSGPAPLMNSWMKGIKAKFHKFDEAEGEQLLRGRQ